MVVNFAAVCQYFNKTCDDDDGILLVQHINVIGPITVLQKCVKNCQPFYILAVSPIFKCVLLAACSLLRLDSLFLFIVS